MAASRREINALAKLVPESRQVEVGGREVRVPGNRDEAILMNKVMASQIMAVYQEALEAFREDGVKFAPKELRDLIESGKSVAQQMDDAFSKDASESGIRQIQAAEAQSTTEVDFSSLSKIPEVTTTPNANLKVQ